MFLVFSSVFFMNPRKFNIANLAYIFAYTLIFFTLEDFYWFVLNPYYTLDGTNLKTGKKAWWHYKIGSVPVLYIALPLIALSLCMYAGYLRAFHTQGIPCVWLSRCRDICGCVAADMRTCAWRCSSCVAGSLLALPVG